jgi:hypothetical protein
MVDPVLCGDVVLVEGNIIGLSGEVIGVVMTDDLEGVPIEIKEYEYEERDGEQE